MSPKLQLAQLEQDQKERQEETLQNKPHAEFQDRRDKDKHMEDFREVIIH